MKNKLTAREAAAELGIGVASLYAYVSRGMIRSEPQPGTRTKLYSAEDVRALKGRVAGAAPPGAGGFGPAPIETALTLIRDDRLFYRGIDVETLARHARLEAVASLLWDTGDADPFAATAQFQTAAVPEDGGIVGRLLVGLARAAETDLAGYAPGPAAIARTGARILRQMTHVATGAPLGTDQPIHAALAKAWNAPAEPIRRALVLMADHELAASTLAVRVTASTGASPWRAVTSGLACLDGPRHGGMSDRVAALFETVGDGDPERALAERLKAGETLPGFGHPLYRGEDPRSRLLVEAVRARPEAARVIARADAIAAAAERLTGRHPNLDFGLVVAARAIGLPAEAPITLFAIARTVGWIGHVIEQSAVGKLIRIRATYIGRRPD